MLRAPDLVFLTAARSRSAPGFAPTMPKALQPVDRLTEDDVRRAPARGLAERRVKTSPLHDVGGMLRLFDCAAASGIARFSERSRVSAARE